jgi:hypothetical protein
MKLARLRRVDMTLQDLRQQKSVTLHRVDGAVSHMLQVTFEGEVRHGR